MYNMIDIIANLHDFQQRLRVTEQKYHRPDGSVTLLAVSKGKSAEQLIPLVDEGQQHLGENYLQEALEKISALAKKNIIWHFIGQIQTNKIRDIAPNFSWVHTISRLKEAQMLSQFRPPELPPLQICIQIKFDNASQKGGIPPSELISLYQQIHSLPRLQVRGLMTLPPFVEDVEKQRKYFRLLHKAWQQLNEQGAHLDTLSMGMTQDFEAAIAEGSTMIRIGQGIFGSRNTKTLSP